MRTKDETLAAYKSFEAWALTQGHCTAIKVLRSDRGGEYLSDAFNAHLAAAGTARKLTVHDMPQLNGVAERLNRTLLERIRAFAHGSGLPKSLWGEALRHAVWLKNRTGTRALDGKRPFRRCWDDRRTCLACVCGAATFGYMTPIARSWMCVRARRDGSALTSTLKPTESSGQERAP